MKRWDDVKHDKSKQAAAYTDHVRQSREAGHSWAAIAAELGITRQAAHQHYSGQQAIHTRLSAHQVWWIDHMARRSGVTRATMMRQLLDYALAHYLNED